MIPVKLEDPSRSIGKPKDWDDEVSGPCETLDVYDVEMTDGNYMLSKWRPEPIELEALNQGGEVGLWIRGSLHPVVMVSTHYKE